MPLLVFCFYKIGYRYDVNPSRKSSSRTKTGLSIKEIYWRHMMTSQICVTCIVGLAHHIKFTWRHRFKEKYRKTVWYNFFLKLTLGYCVPLTVSITVNFPKTFVKMNIRKFWKFRCISVPYFLIDRGSLSITQKSYKKFRETG